MKEYTGFLLDMYQHPENGVIIWLLCDDGIRRMFHQDFEFVFYIHRDHLPLLRGPWQFLRSRECQLGRADDREDLYDGPLSVMEVRTRSWKLHNQLSQEVQKEFPTFTYYDIDTSVQLRYYAQFKVFPMARCHVQVDHNKVQVIEPLDSPWDIDPPEPPLRILNIKPNIDPYHAQPTHLFLGYDGFDYKADLSKPRDVLFLLNVILRQYDPDVILTEWGDTWLLPHLFQIAKDTGIPFRPNRDLSRDVLRKRGRSFFNYGRAHLRGPQIHLFGRIQIDTMNCMSYKEYGLTGTLEISRISGLPIQEAARRSAGAAISAMQVLTAMRRGVMIPYRNQKGEIYKTYNQLNAGDSGGFVDEPEPGVEENAIIIDLFMSHPSIMIAYNISHETVGVNDKDAWEIPGLGLKVSSKRGLVPETLEPMRDKRAAFKRALKTMSEDDPRYRRFKKRSDAIKQIGIVSNGRMGFANSIFGVINAFEAISYISKMILLQAKQIAEKHGFTKLHMYVDSLFIRKDGVITEADLKPMLDEIEEVIKIPIEVEDIYSWIAFDGSMDDPDIPVSNRFFCRKRNGEFKVRGLMQRRRDTCPFVAQIQEHGLAILSQEPDPKRLRLLLPQIVDLARNRLADLQAGAVPTEQLLVTQSLSRELEQFKANTPLRAACSQLAAAGKTVQMGQVIRYVHTRGDDSAHAWDLPTPIDSRKIDIPHYKEQVLRAMYELVMPLGVPKDLLQDWLFGEGCYIDPVDFHKVKNLRFDSELPLFARLNAYEKELISLI